MNIELTCKYCGVICISIRSLSKHLRDKHQVKLNDYYDKFYKQIGDGICVVCKVRPTKFLNVDRGYAPTCSHECGGKYFRANLKNNPVKFLQFSKKMTDKNHKMWDRWRNTGFDKIGSGNSAKLKYCNTAVNPIDKRKRRKLKNNYGRC